MTTPEERFERSVADLLAEIAPTRLPNDLIPESERALDATRRWPRWLALIKEPPMRTSSHLAVGSPMARVAVILATTLLLVIALAAAGITGSRMLAADAVIVVAQDGSGHYTTIGDAVAAAQDGDTISVRPGTYEESVLVSGTDLIIRGDGNRDDIVVVSASTEPPADLTSIFWSRDVWPPAWAFILADTDTELANMTIMGPAAGIGIASVGSEASTTLDSLVVRMPEATGDENPVNWNAGAGGVLRDSLVEGWLGIGPNARIVIEGNELPASCVVLWESGTDLTVRNNVIHGCPYEQGINVVPGNDVLIEGNDVWVEDVPGESSDAAAILVNSGDSGGGTVIIRDNDLHDSLHGITVEADETRQVEITGNRIYDNTRMLSSSGVVLRSPAVLSDNIVSGNSIGVRVATAGDMTLMGNAISGNDSGLQLTSGAAPRAQGNTICDNRTNVRATDEVAADLAATNEICEDVTTD